MKDFQDGTPARLRVWKRKGSQETLVDEISGVVKGNKVEAFWKVPSEEELEKGEESEYYFVADIEGEERGSDTLTLALELKYCDVLEVEDVHFNHDSAVVLPDALDDLACGYLYAMENPSKLLLIAGHTDKSGPARYNQWLSKKRAENVLHILLGGRDAWVSSTSSLRGPTQAHPNGKSKVEDYQMILKWVATTYGWSCDPGEIYNTEVPKTRETIKVFQERYNSSLRARVRGRSIKEDGLMGPETWGAFFDVYMLELAELLGLDSDISRLETYRNSLKFINGRKIVGGGEDHRITRRYKSHTDRRVELLFFDPKEKPKLGFHPDCHEGPPGDLTKAGKCELYGKEAIYEQTPLTCDLDHILFIEVLDREGNGMSDVAVVIERDSEGVFETGRTNTNGVFMVRDVPEGIYTVSVDTHNLPTLAGFKEIKERVEISK